MTNPPIGKCVILIGPFGEAYGYWTGEKYLQAVVGEDVDLVDVVSWREATEEERK